MGGNRTVGCAELLLLLACGWETAAKHADDIPRANTGGNPPYVCGQPTMPPPVLAECTDVISEAALGADRAVCRQGYYRGS